MTALTLIDANGNPITCGSLDVAGDPTAFDGNPVVVLQDDGTFTFEEMAGGGIGKGTNIDVWSSPNGKNLSFIYVGDVLSTTIDGVEYFPLTPGLIALTLTQVLEGIDGYDDSIGRGSESGVDFTVAGTPPFEYFEGKPEELKLVAIMQSYTYGRWAGTSDAPSAPLVFTHDVSLIAFDSASGSGSSLSLDGAVVSDTFSATERKMRSSFETSEYWAPVEREVVPGSVEQVFNERVRYNVPFTIPEGKSWMLFSSNVQVNGTPIESYPDLTFGELSYGLRVNLQG